MPYREIYKLWNLLEDLQVANNNNQTVVAPAVGTKQSEKDLLQLRPSMKLAYIPWIFHPLIKLQGRYETDHQAKDGPLIETREITPINDTYQTVLNKKEY
jgi:hypothetical protein